MSDIKISPCPFCGSEVEDYGAMWDSSTVEMELRCPKCGVSVTIHTDYEGDDPEAEAIRAWNKRVGGGRDGRIH